jgi:hypothetical protein
MPQLYHLEDRIHKPCMVINKRYKISLTIQVGSRKRSTDISMYDLKNVITLFGTFSSLVGLLFLYAIHTSTKISKVKSF